jgi:AcrR family transcriptional regulator
MKKTARQLQKEQTREHLLQTAYELYSEQGIMKTRMSDIAHAADVSHGTVFAHFQTQEALIEEVIETFCYRIAMRTHALAECCENMEALLRSHLSSIMEYEKFYTKLIVENQMLPPGARDSWIGVQSAISFHFSKICDRDKDLREITAQNAENNSESIPAHMLFNLWMGLVHYYLENGDLFAPEGNVIRRYQETLIGSYIKLLKRK